jgi:hypothetical protein
VIRRARQVYLAILLVQACHAVEEYALGFTEAFPPARALGRLLPGVARPGFVVFNALLLLSGLAGYLFCLRPWGQRAPLVLWVMIAIEGYNGFGHVIWALLVDGYDPGLITALILLPLVGYLFWLLRWSGQAAGNTASTSTRTAENPAIVETGRQGTITTQ